MLLASRGAWSEISPLSKVLPPVSLDGSRLLLPKVQGIRNLICRGTMTASTRDYQRSAVYAWEASQEGRAMHEEVYSHEATADMLQRVWKAERGRYGLAKRPAPQFKDGRGTRHARAGGGRVNLPRWARNDWVILHELAHCLAGRLRGGGHGPRFVGIMIGLLARHAGRDGQSLVDSAAAAGVDVDVRSVGAIPVRSRADQLATLMPVSMMDAAVELDCSYRQVQGLALVLIKQGRARWFRRRLVAAPAERPR